MLIQQLSDAGALGGIEALPALVHFLQRDLAASDLGAPCPAITLRPPPVRLRTGARDGAE